MKKLILYILVLSLALSLFTPGVYADDDSDDFFAGWTDDQILFMLGQVKAEIIKRGLPSSIDVSSTTTNSNYTDYDFSEWSDDQVLLSLDQAELEIAKRGLSAPKALQSYVVDDDTLGSERAVPKGEDTRACNNNEFVLSEDVQSAFISDLSSALTTRWSISDQDTSTMTDKQTIDYYSGLVMAELDYIGKYSSYEFNDPVLNEYAHTYISALHDQLVAISEYYGKDDVLYYEYWSNGYRKRGQMIYWINRKYGLTIPEELNDILKEMVEVGKYWDMSWSIQETISSQLQKVDCSFTKGYNNSVKISPFEIRNNSNYYIDLVNISVEFLNENGSLIDSYYLFSGNNIAPNANMQTQKYTIQIESFSQVRFSVTTHINSGYYNDQCSFEVNPQIQYAWDSKSIMRDGDLAAGQEIIELQDILFTWDYNKSWSQTLYVPQLKFSAKNVGTKAADKIVVHCVFKNTETKEIWDEETEYVIGSSDSPLDPGYSKKAFVYSSVGYETPPSTIPHLDVDIYVNDVLLETIQ